MISKRARLTLFAALTPLLGAGSMSQLEKSPAMTDALPTIGAGHTGCLSGAITFKARVRIDTPKEREYYRHGGILQYVLRQLAASGRA